MTSDKTKALNYTDLIMIINILNMRMYRRQYLQKPEHIKSQLEKRDSTIKDNKQIQ